jgi:hypothetical protein
MAAKVKKETKERTPEQQAKINARVAKMIAARDAKKTGEGEAVQPIKSETNQAMETKAETKEQEVKATSPSEFEQLKQMLLQQQEEINRLKQGAAPAQQPVYQQPIDRARQKFGTSVRKEIAPADRLEAPKTYIIVGGGFVLSVYQKNGTEVYAPHDKACIFQPTFTDKRRMADGKDRDCIFSGFTTYSKPECKFIEESPYWKTLIFSKTSEAMKVDYEALERLKAISDEIHRMSEVQTLSMAQSYNLDIYLPLDTIREQLKNIRIADRMQYEEAATRDKLKQFALPPNE